jgi:Arc/MetJ-type ribon-helix-helix transcriptional regulator
MLTVRLDEETERQLADLLAREKGTNRSELIKRLIRERWLTLQPGTTLVDRRGGHPQHLLQDAPPDLSERPNRKQAIAEYIQKRHS